MRILLHKKAVTLIEILVVAVVAGIILSSLTLIWMRTGSTATKGGEMMDLQLAAKAINERLRNDVRTLTAVKTASEKEIVFLALSRGKKIEISYVHDSAKKTLKRIADGNVSDFNAAGKVGKVLFSCNPSIKEFSSLHMAIELESKGQGSVSPSKLAQISEFSSRSLDPPFFAVE